MVLKTQMSKQELESTQSQADVKLVQSLHKLINDPKELEEINHNLISLSGRADALSMVSTPGKGFPTQIKLATYVFSEDLRTLTKNGLANLDDATRAIQVIQDITQSVVLDCIHIETLFALETIPCATLILMFCKVNHPHLYPLLVSTLGSLIIALMLRPETSHRLASLLDNCLIKRCLLRVLLQDPQQDIKSDHLQEINGPLKLGRTLTLYHKLLISKSIDLDPYTLAVICDRFVCSYNSCQNIKRLTRRNVLTSQNEGLLFNNLMDLLECCESEVGIESSTIAILYCGGLSSLERILVKYTNLRNDTFSHTVRHLIDKYVETVTEYQSYLDIGVEDLEVMNKVQILKFNVSTLNEQMDVLLELVDVPERLIDDSKFLKLSTLALSKVAIGIRCNLDICEISKALSSYQVPMATLPVLCTVLCEYCKALVLCFSKSQNSFSDEYPLHRSLPPRPRRSFFGKSNDKDASAESDKDHFKYLLQGAESACALLNLYIRISGRGQFSLKYMSEGITVSCQLTLPQLIIQAFLNCLEAVKYIESCRQESAQLLNVLAMSSIEVFCANCRQIKGYYILFKELFDRSQKSIFFVQVTLEIFNMLLAPLKVNTSEKNIKQDLTLLEPEIDQFILRWGLMNSRYMSIQLARIAALGLESIIFTSLQRYSESINPEYAHQLEIVRLEYNRITGSKDLPEKENLTRAKSSVGMYLPVQNQVIAPSLSTPPPPPWNFQNSINVGNTSYNQKMNMQYHEGQRYLTPNTGRPSSIHVDEFARRGQQ